MKNAQLIALGAGLALYLSIAAMDWIATAAWCVFASADRCSVEALFLIGLPNALLWPVRLVLWLFG